MPCPVQSVFWAIQCGLTGQVQCQSRCTFPKGQQRVSLNILPYRLSLCLRIAVVSWGLTLSGSTSATSRPASGLLSDTHSPYLCYCAELVSLLRQ